MRLNLKPIFYLSLLLLIGASEYIHSDNTSISSGINNSICCVCNGPCTGACDANFTCPNDCCFNCGSRSCNGDCFGNNPCCSNCCDTPIKTHVHPRSVGANTARELVGWQWELNRPFMCENYGALYLAYEYQQTFRPERIANQLFGGCVLRFSGSKVPNRNACNELLADNFGLSENFIGSIKFNPQIRNHIIDFGYYQGLDCWLQGAYLRIHAPIAFSCWNLCGCECVVTTSPVFTPCYMDSSAVGDPFTPARVVPAIQSIEDALLGCTTFGDMKTPWCAGRIASCNPNIVRLADIDLILGYNFYNTDCSHFGLYLQAVLPTGNKATDKYLFSPVVGNGGHLELGAGVSAHAVIWGCETNNLAVFLEGNITSMIKNRQCRVFDFCGNGPFSRYMLLKEYAFDGKQYFYDGNLVSATCITNQLVNVRVDIKGDASLKLAWRCCGWGFDLGYNIYGHSKEVIERITDCNTDCCLQTPFKYAPKGDDGVCCSCYPVIQVADEASTLKLVPDGTLIGIGTSVLPGCAPLENNIATVFTLPNNAAQPDATACKPGSSNENQVLELEAKATFTPGPNQTCYLCLNYDSPAVTDTSGETIGTLNPPTTPVQALQTLENNGFIVCNSVTPNKFLSADDINLHSAEAVSTLTQKIFAHFSYTWYDCCGFNPNIGVGGEVEFDGQGRCSNFDTKNSYCLPTNIYQWGVWVKGGISF